MENELFAASSLDGKFTVYEDEEQYTRMTEILELLVSAGYFRAKIHGLSAFDKIVGGMVWCISLCAESVDVDLLYSENSSIGQKIALTENIVKVLPKFKCPHSIEPHQIQGLDCIQIFPVIQWLVKEAIEAKKKYGDETRRFSAHQFDTFGWTLEQDRDRPLPPPRARQRPRRVLTRTDETKTRDFDDDLRCTLLEYGHQASDVVVRGHLVDDEEPARHKRKELEAQFLQNLQIAEKLKSELQDIDPTTSKKVSTRAVTDLIDSSKLGQVAFTSEGLKEVVSADERLRHVRDENAELKSRLAVLAEDETHRLAAIERSEAELDELRTKSNEHDQFMSSVDSELLTQARALLDECKQIRTDESTYKRECRTKMHELEAEIDRLESRPDSTVASSVEGTTRQQLDELRRELAAINREIFVLSRQIDSKPTQIELNQYQRRFVELYNQVTAKHLEARRLCSYHNTLVDVCDFVRTEITLLNNIDDQKHLAISKSYNESFLRSLEELVRNVTGSLNGLSKRKQLVQQKRDDLATDLQQLQDQHRQYNRAIAEFQEECQINEELSVETEPTT